ncbi:MAG: type II/IV secretion system protein, partial [Planctomycetota bacterium]
MDTGELLLNEGLLSADQLAQLRAEANGHSTGMPRIDTAAVERGWLTEEQALRSLGQQMGCDYVDLESADVDLALLNDFPQRLIHRHALFPVSRHNGTLVVATSDPFELYPIDEAGALTGLAIEPVLSPRSQIAARIKAHLGVGSETVEGLLA